MFCFFRRNIKHNNRHARWHSFKIAQNSIVFKFPAYPSTAGVCAFTAAAGRDRDAPMTAYYYVEDVDASLEVLRLIQACIKYLDGPTAVDGDELKRKLDYLDRLWTTWTHRGAGGTDDCSSCPSEVYKQVCGEYY